MPIVPQQPRRAVPAGHRRGCSSSERRSISLAAGRARAAGNAANRPGVELLDDLSCESSRRCRPRWRPATVMRPVPARVDRAPPRLETRVGETREERRGQHLPSRCGRRTTRRDVERSMSTRRSFTPRRHRSDRCRRKDRDVYHRPLVRHRRGWPRFRRRQHAVQLFHVNVAYVEQHLISGCVPMPVRRRSPVISLRPSRNACRAATTRRFARGPCRSAGTVRWRSPKVRSSGRGRRRVGSAARSRDPCPHRPRAREHAAPAPSHRSAAGDLERCALVADHGGQIAAADLQPSSCPSNAPRARATRAARGSST